MNNNWWNRHFHKRVLEEQLKREALERELAARAAFNRLHNATYIPRPLTVTQDEELLKPHPKKLNKHHYEGDSYSNARYVPSSVSIPDYVPDLFSSSSKVEDDRPSFSPGGGSFGGGGASASWEPSEPSPSFSDVSSGSSSSSDSYSSSSSSDSSSSSSDSGSSSSGD